MRVLPPPAQVPSAAVEARVEAAAHRREAAASRDEARAVQAMCQLITREMLSARELRLLQATLSNGSHSSNGVIIGGV